MKQLISDNVNLNDPLVFANWVKDLQAALTVEDWHEVGAANEPAFSTNWANSASQETAAFRKVNNQIFIKGRCSKSVNGTNPDTIFTLPESYRPNNIVLCRFVYSPWTTGSCGLLHINSTGDIQVYAVGLTSGFEVGINTSFYLDN